MRAQFSEPVTVLVGLGMPVVIDSVTNAISVLDDMPHAAYDAVHATVRANCVQALQGLKPASVARDVLEAYFEQRGMLIETVGHGMLVRDAEDFAELSA